MSIKWIGALFVMVSCGGFGFSLAASHTREVNALRQLSFALDYMECELQYRLTPLPELCRQAGEGAKGCVRDVLLSLAGELEAQISPDVESCMRSALRDGGDIPREVSAVLTLLGQTLGRFDLPGQLKGLEAARSDCRRRLEALTDDQGPRLRSYQTLGLCAGAALAILFI